MAPSSPPETARLTTPPRSLFPVRGIGGTSTKDARILGTKMPAIWAQDARLRRRVYLVNSSELSTSDVEEWQPARSLSLTGRHAPELEDDDLTIEEQAERHRVYLLAVRDYSFSKTMNGLAGKPDYVSQYRESHRKSGPDVQRGARSGRHRRL